MEGCGFVSVLAIIPMLPVADDILLPWKALADVMYVCVILLPLHSPCIIFRSKRSGSLPPLDDQRLESRGSSCRISVASLVGALPPSALPVSQTANQPLNIRGHIPIPRERETKKKKKNGTTRSNFHLG